MNFLFSMFLYISFGFVLGNAGVMPDKWQYWVSLLILMIVDVHSHAVGFPKGKKNE